MNRIAEAECATCYRIRPKTEMRPITIRRKSGSSFGLWQSGSNSADNRRGGGSYQASFSHLEAWVCPECKVPGSERTLAHYALAIFLVLLIILPLSLCTSSSTVGNAGDKVDRVTAFDEQNVNGTDFETSATIDVSPERQVDEAPSLSEPALDDPPIQFDFQIAEIREAQLKAVTKGKAIRWSAGQYKGFSVPSDVSVSPEMDIQCRNVYSTLDGTSEQSPIFRMCQSPTGVWALAD